MAREPDAEPRRRAGDQGRYGRLSRDRVLAAALDLVDREGLSALSMRKVAAELGVEAMALYRYASGKDGLLDGLVEAVYVEMESGMEPLDQDAGWRAGLHHIARATYRMTLTHPHVVPLLATRMLTVPLARRPLPVLRVQERTLALLEDAGLDGRQAATASRAVTAWVLGYVFVGLRAMVDNPDEPEPAFRLGLHRLPAQDFPRLRDVAPDLAEPAGEGSLAVGLDALLDRFVEKVQVEPGKRQ